MQKYVIIISSLTLLALCDAQKSARCDFTIQGTYEINRAAKRANITLMHVKYAKQFFTKR